MIPVKQKPQPKDFLKKVEQPGRAWLKREGLTLNAPIPSGKKPPPHWRKCIKQLHSSYRGVCAYLSVFLELPPGAVTVDHYVAKSKLAGKTYKWSNYRLASATMNSRKRDYDTVLDPFSLKSETFHLDLVTGRMYPNPVLTPAARAKADATIQRLGLDKPCREMRVRRFDDYRELVAGGPNAAAVRHLKKYSPFIWYEAKRQGLL